MALSVHKIGKLQVSSLFNTLSICTYGMRTPIQFIQFMLTATKMLETLKQLYSNCYITDNVSTARLNTHLLIQLMYGVCVFTEEQTTTA